MSRTCYIRLLLGLFLLFATGQAQDGQGLDSVRLTTTSWDKIRIYDPFNITWTFEDGKVYPVRLYLGSIDVDGPNNYVIYLSTILERGKRSWIWVPTPDLFDDDMKEWSPTRLWYVGIQVIDDCGNADVSKEDKSPKFLIAPALDEGMPGSTTGILSTSPLTSPTPTATANPTSGIPTKDPEVDPSSGHDNLSAGAKAGIGLGCGVLVVSVVALFAILRHRRKTQKRHLTLFTGSAINDTDRGNKSRVNIADMIPACPAPGSPTGTRVPVLADKDDPSPMYELQGSMPSPVGSPASPQVPVELPASTSKSAELADYSSPVISPASLTSSPPSSPGANARRPDSIVASMSNSEIDWSYDPVRGSYGAPAGPPAS